MHSATLQAWDDAVTQYLTTRHAFGRAFRKEQWILARLRRFLVEQGGHDLNQRSFDRWRRQFGERSPNTRLVYERTVYNFYRYRRRAEPTCFLPNPDSLVRAQPHPLPTIIEPAQVVAVLKHIATIADPACPFRFAVLRLAIVLLYTTGLRRGELTRLTLDDVEADSGVLRIRASKFHKSRWAPLSSSARAELRRYLVARRRAGMPADGASPLLCTRAGRQYTGDGLGDSLKIILAGAGLRDAAGRPPRIQDFRHSFAVAALLRWYEDGADVQANLPKLALYMGHVSIASTAYYLRWMPAVIGRAGERFERACGTLVQEERP